MNHGNIIHLVMGISSVGKSSYIESRIKNGIWNEIPVIMAYELEQELTNKLLDQECVIHYNLLRPYNNNVEYINNDFLADPVLARLIEYHERIRAYVLIANHSEIAKRILLRNYVEPKLRETIDPYPRQQIFEVFCHLDLNDFYHKWFLFLKTYHICFDIIKSSGGKYLPISSLGEASEIFSEKNIADSSDQEIEYILRTNKFCYRKNRNIFRQWFGKFLGRVKAHAYKKSIT